MYQIKGNGLKKSGRGTVSPCDLVCDIMADERMMDRYTAESKGGGRETVRCALQLG